MPNPGRGLNGLLWCWEPTRVCVLCGAFAFVYKGALLMNHTDSSSSIPGHQLVETVLGLHTVALPVHISSREYPPTRWKEIEELGTRKDL